MHHVAPGPDVRDVRTISTVLAEAVTVEEVAQLQLFVPNFIDDVIDSLDAPTRAQLDALIADPESTSEVIASFIADQVGDAFSAAGAALQDAYLFGTWANWPSRTPTSRSIRRYRRMTSRATRCPTTC